VLARHKLDLVVLPIRPRPILMSNCIVSSPGDWSTLSSSRLLRGPIHALNSQRVENTFIALGRSRSGGAHPWIDLDSRRGRYRRRRLVEHGHRRIAVALPANESNLGYVFLNATGER